MAVSYTDRLLFVTILIFLGACIVHCKAHTYYVKPNSSAPCHESGYECYTLLYYVQNSQKYFVSDTKFIFLPGNHSLNVGELVLIQDEANLTLIGNDTLVPAQYNEVQWFESTSKIICSNFSGFAFANISNLSITNLTFVSCGAYITEQLGNTTVHVHTLSLYLIGKKMKVSIFLVNVSSLEIDHTCVRNGKGYGVLGINVLGSSILGSTFVRNNEYTLIPIAVRCSIGNISECQGGNALFVYGDPIGCYVSGETISFSVVGSLFAYGVDLTGVNIIGMSNSHPYISRSTGLGIALGQSAYGFRGSITSVTSVGNVAYEGANFYFRTFSSVSNLYISMVNVVSKNGTGIPKPFLHNGTGVGLFYHYGIPYPHSILLCIPSNTSQHIFNVTNSQFVGNQGSSGAGVYVELWAQLAMDLNSLVHFSNCTISNNVGYSNGIGLCISEEERFSKDISTAVVLQGMNVTNNHFLVRVGRLSEVESDSLFTVTALLGIQNISIVGCHFSYNGVTALYVFGSNVFLSGNITFMGNVGIRGAGIALDNSIMYLQQHTTMEFTYNRARLTGGAMYIVTHANDPLQHTCFFQIDTNPFLPLEQLDIGFLFRENHADIAGSDLYGGWIDRCNLITGPFVQARSGEVFNYIFNISNSMISSVPNFVCVCDNNSRPLCGNSLHNVTAYPGQTFPLSVVAVGQRQEISVPADVVLVFDTPRPPAKFGSLENPQTTNTTCTDLYYSISSPNTWELVHFEVQDTVFLDEPCHINITLLKCPPGFEFSNLSFQCECTQLLDIKCDITTQTLQRVSNVWIAALDNTFVFSNYCPFDYCIPYHDASSINPLFPNSQCAFNHSGILCGNCSDGLSVVLGSSRCLKCSNSYVTLLIAFALAGLALVLFLMFFNVTVSVGTINGLIFYANILQVNRATFFPGGDINPLTVFISWLNLDLGIETCFYTGMDSYTKAWLQFAFPIYIWLIIGSIIILSRYSVTVSKVCGSNSVSVLATLMLLSFTKIMSAAIIALQFGVLEFENGRKETVWLYDGNLRYFSSRRTVLFIVTLVFLIPSVAYILFLLFSQWLLAKATPWNALRYIAKLKPIVDAYNGPYKDKYRYWTGFMLLVRGILFLIFSTTFELVGVNRLVIAVSVYLLITLHWSGGGVYKKKWVSVLEFSFLLNLGILTTAALFNGLVNGSQEATVYTSVGIALLTSIGILAYHVHAQVWRRYSSTHKISPSFPTRYLSCCRETEPLLDASDETDPLLYIS